MSATGIMNNFAASHKLMLPFVSCLRSVMSVILSGFDQFLSVHDCEHSAIDT